MVDILNITGEPIFDDSIVKIEAHTYNPYANTTFGDSDEIRIPLEQQDFYTLPCDSFLYVEGRLTVKKENDQMSSTLGNNCVAFMFDEIRYELNGVEIDRNRNVRITSIIKNYVSMTYDKALIALNAGWNSRSDTEEGYFNFCVQLNMLLGFCEFALQTGRKNIMSQDVRVFDECNFSNVKVYLSSEFYSYDDLNLDFGKKICAVLFDLYARFLKVYYGIDCFETLLTVLSFIEKEPFAVKLLECVMSEGVSGNLPESVGGADLYSLTLAGTNVRALEQTIRITDFNWPDPHATLA
ncbi:hypothetical protein ALC57_09068 [Trachymyrmex cornetzi]|uniref:Double jelly roll-like domain-containing protein n=1 Tax=Trachymyrmex cornetzi TaxID=471704 RepID=A0A151J5Y7_9HYME|nr:hypothetical protein ALC57_09068 [Trachymyrmex cornetzi]